MQAIYHKLKGKVMHNIKFCHSVSLLLISLIIFISTLSFPIPSWSDDGNPAPGLNSPMVPVCLGGACGNPAPGSVATAIELVSFTVSSDGDKVKLKLNWVTASEIDNAGFNIWRRISSGGQDFEKINTSLIPAQGSPTSGASYNFTDYKVVDGDTHYYRLEDIDLKGKSTFYGTTVAASLASDNASGNASASTGEKAKWCFIATAAYGSYLDPHVQILREFRDKYLLTNTIGQSFVELYYKLSPPAADFIARHEVLKAITRILLLPFVGFSAFMIKTTLLEKLIAIFIPMIILLTWVLLKKSQRVRVFLLSALCPMPYAKWSILFCLILTFSYANPSHAAASCCVRGSKSNSDQRTTDTTYLNPGTQMAGVSIDIGSHAIRVNTYNGSLYYNYEVVDISGIGAPIGYNLSYNSRTRHSPSGEYGWGMQSYTGLRYKTASDGDIAIIMEDSGIVRFDKQGSNFIAPPGVEASLTTYGSGYLLTMEHGTKFYFENPSHTKITRIVDTNSNTLTYTYNETGLLTNVTDASGRQMGFTYNANKQITKITEPNAKETNFAYDANYNLSSVTDKLGNITTYTYDSDHRLTSVIANGKTVSITYSTFTDFGEGVDSITSNGSTWTFNYNAATKIHTVTNPLLQTTKYTYDSYTDGRITKIEDHLANITTYEWNSDSHLTKETDALGRITNYTYDANGNLLTQKEAAGTGLERTTTNTYSTDGFNNIASITDPLDRIATYTYNANGNRLTMTEAFGAAFQRTTTLTYNSAGQPITMTNPKNVVTTYGYDSYGNNTITTVNPSSLNIITTHTYEASTGNRLTTTDPNLNTTTYQYDNRNRLTKITNAAGNFTTYTYDAMDNKLTETDYKGNTTAWTYNLINNAYRVITATDALNKITTNTYDAAGNRTTVTDPLGNTTTYSYDALNRVTGITNALSQTTTFTYDAVDNRLTETNPNLRTTTYTYDNLNRPISTTDALSNTTTYTYDALNNRTAVTDAKGIITAYNYDVLNRVTTEVRNSGGINAANTYTYDAENNKLTQTDPNDKITTYTYDAANRITAQTNAASETTSYTYDSAGNQKTITSPGGNVLTYNYDILNRVTSITDTLGTVASYTYDANSNKLTETDGNSNTVTYAYDVLNRVTTTTDSLANNTTNTYNANSNLLTQTDRNSNVTTFTYDALNRKKTVKDALNNTTTNNYDTVGNLSSIVDAKGSATTYTYDDINRLTIETYANATTKEYTYDQVGNKLTRKDNNGIFTYYTYDNLYRLTNRNYPGANDDNFTYDTGGRMVTASNSNAAISYTYDNANRQLTETLNSKTTGYSYDTPNRKRTIGYPGSRIIIENMNLRQRLDTITEGINTITDYAYDAGNRQTTRLYLNARTATNAYNANNWITGLTHDGSVAQFNYTFDNEGNRLYQEKAHRTTNSEKYNYDAIYRVTQYKEGTLSGVDVPAPLTQTQYNYDGVGNRTTTVHDAATTTYTTNNMNQYTQIVNGGTKLPTHDNNGNLTSDGTNTYTYDYENRLTAVNGGVTAQYKYDPMGRRIQKIAGAATTNYYFDGSRIIEERNAVDATIATYTFGTGIDETLSMDRGGATYYYHQNSLGSITAVTNSAGSVVERYEYDAYGKVTIYNAAWTVLGSSAISNPYMYTGREYDNETGLYYYRARYYDPTHGRFMQQDPLGYVDGMNLYEYVGGNAVNLVDPSGMYRIISQKDCDVCNDCTATDPPPFNPIPAEDCKSACSACNYYWNVALKIGGGCSIGSNSYTDVGAMIPPRPPGSPWCWHWHPKGGGWHNHCDLPRASGNSSHSEGNNIVVVWSSGNAISTDECECLSWDNNGDCTSWNHSICYPPELSCFGWGSSMVCNGKIMGNTSHSEGNNIVVVWSGGGALRSTINTSKSNTYRGNLNSSRSN